MEKYRKFSDPKTGKHPFLSIPSQKPKWLQILGFLLVPLWIAFLILYFLFIYITVTIFGKNNILSMYL